MKGGGGRKRRENLEGGVRMCVREGRERKRGEGREGEKNGVKEGREAESKGQLENKYT